MADSVAPIAARLDRMDKKLDDVVEALNVLAKVEERQAHHKESMAQLREWVQGHEDRLSTVERWLVEQKVKVGVGERLFWVLVSVGLAGLNIVR